MEVEVVDAEVIVVEGEAASSNKSESSVIVTDSKSLSVCWCYSEIIQNDSRKVYLPQNFRVFILSGFLHNYPI